MRWLLAAVVVLSATANEAPLNKALCSKLTSSDAISVSCEVLGHSSQVCLELRKSVAHCPDVQSTKQTNDELDLVTPPAAQSSHHQAQPGLGEGLGVLSRPFLKGGWVRSSNDLDCGSMCLSKGKTCNSAMQSKLTTEASVKAAFAEAGFPCKKYAGARGYAGAPFSHPQWGCFGLKPGSVSSCNKNKYTGHSPLCYCAGEAPPKVSHSGFENVSWWNITLWRDLQAQSPSVDCNPAHCGNPDVCQIPNCTLVIGDLSKRFTYQCDTVAKQKGTGTSDCIPQSYRHAWPGTTDEEACSQLMKCKEGQAFTSSFQPATRLAFCACPSGSSYYTTFTFMIPNDAMEYKKDFYHWAFLGSNGFSYNGGWSLSERQYWAWPFDNFALTGVESTRNIGVFIKKRALCKRDPITGTNRCYNMKFAKCYKTKTDFATAEWPSQVSSTHVHRLLQDATKTECVASLLKKVLPSLQRFISAQ